MSRMHLPPPGEWTLQAKCRNLGAAGDLLFPNPRAGKDIAAAKQFCRGCPVTAQCLADGAGDRYGVRGGLTGDERRRLAIGSRVAACESCRLPFVPRPANPRQCTGCTRRFHRPVSPEDYKDDILAMHAAGASGEELAEYFGFSRDEIRTAGLHWNVALMRITSTVDCGTAAGRRSHERRGEPVCGPCREADRQYRAQRRALVAA